MVFKFAKVIFLSSPFFAFGFLAFALTFQTGYSIVIPGFDLGVALLGISSMLFISGIILIGLPKADLATQWYVYVAAIPWVYWFALPFFGNSVWP